MIIQAASSAQAGEHVRVVHVHALVVQHYVGVHACPILISTLIHQIAASVRLTSLHLISKLYRYKFRLS